MEGNLERRFFKVMMPGFEHKLTLPPAYSAEIREEKGRRVTLESRQGKWDMKLRRDQNEFFLGNGWPSFVTDHALSVGDFMVFRRQSHLHFKVSVFDSSMSEKLFQLSSPAQVGETRDAIGRPFFMIMLPNFEEKLRLPQTFCEEIKQEKSKTAILESRKGRWEVDVCRKDVQIFFEDGWPEFAIDHALSDRDLLVLEHTRHLHFHVAVFDSSACEKMFVPKPKRQRPVPKSKAPSCSKTKQSPQHIFKVKITSFTASRIAVVSIPRKFVSENRLMEKKRVVLIDGGGRRWEVTLVAQHNIGRLRMGSGWPAFCRGNNLKAGDVCVFQLHPSSLSSTTIFLHVTVLNNNLE